MRTIKRQSRDDDAASASKRERKKEEEEEKGEKASETFERSCVNLMIDCTIVYSR